MTNPTKINYQMAQFLKSAAKCSQLPEDTGIEVAFIGRSNAGKSSALNILTGQKRLARISKTPGRTQLINLFTLDDERMLVDLPGYGYASVPENVKKDWRKLMEDYLAGRKSLKGLVLLMDSRHPMKPFDITMIDYARGLDLPVHILLTKSDKLSKSASQSTLLNLKRELTNFPGDISAQLFSALNRTGLDELRDKMDRWFFSV